MHAHTHLHAMHTERKRMSESYSSGRSPWEVNPVHEVQVTARTWSFTLQAQTQKLTDHQKNIGSTAPQQWGPTSYQWYGWEWGYHQRRMEDPHSCLSTPQCHLSPGRRCQKGSRVPLPVCSPQRSGLVATFLSHPCFLCAVGGCCTLNFTVFCLFYPRPGGFWTTSVSSNMSQQFL